MSRHTIDKDTSFKGNFRVRKMEKDKTLLHDIVSVMRKNNTPSSSVSYRNEQESHSGKPPDEKIRGVGGRRSKFPIFGNINNLTKYKYRFLLTKTSPIQNIVLHG